jgi:hypothetical protein
LGGVAAVAAVDQADEGEGLNAPGVEVRGGEPGVVAVEGRALVVEAGADGGAGAGDGGG